MTLRAVPSVLGKRSLFDLYGLNARPFLRPCIRIQTVNCRIRRYATVQEDQHRGPDSGPPPELKGSTQDRSPGLDPKPTRSTKDESTRLTSDRASRSQPASPISEDKPQEPTKARSPQRDYQASWEDHPDLTIEKFSELPSKDFGVNQHIVINEEFKEALRQILWKFRAPIRYAFAYGSGVFAQGGSAGASKEKLHPSPPAAITKVQTGGHKMIDFIFGVSYTQHWHSLNLHEHRDHYSALGHLGSYAVSKVQDGFGAGVYFNPYVTVNGTLIKYGVVNLDTLCRDLSEWDTLYLAGRLQKPVKILRDNASVRLANQMNLISAVRAALLLLPSDFTENDLYSTIAGISYMGDPRMSVGGDDPRKVMNIVSNQLHNFRRLYAPLIETLPNLSFNDSRCSRADWIDDVSINANLAQNMDPVTRGNMVRRLPKSFRYKLYFEYQSKFNVPRAEFNKLLEESKDDEPDRIRRREGGPFEQRIAKDTEGLRTEMRQVIEATIRWPSLTQSLKGIVTAGLARSWRYAREKRAKGRQGRQRDLDAEAKAKQDQEKENKTEKDKGREKSETE